MRKGRLLLWLFALPLASCQGCERGCLRLAPDAAERGGTSLEGTDCSDGLARCVDDRVEVSRLAHLPHPCGGALSEGRPAPEGRGPCACPWDVVGRCEVGCVASGIAAVAAPDVARRQLCRPGATVTRAAFPGDVAPRICAGPAVMCVDGAVRVCDEAARPERILAVCLHGCDPGIGIDHGEWLIETGFPAILCRRDQPERR